MFVIPRGYHGPCVAAPGYPLYYLNVMAGPGEERSMAFCDDPAHHWVRDTWATMPVDPRVPDDTAAERDRDDRCAERSGSGSSGSVGWARPTAAATVASPALFPDRAADPELVVCADAVPQRREAAVADFGFGTATDDWRRVVDDPAVDVVVVTAPNMLHVEISSAAAAAGKAVFCEKPVGGTPAQIAAAERAARHVTTGVGYNYRWAPLVQCARSLIADGRLGTITNYRGRFLSCYGNDPLGALSWRYLVDEGGYGVTSDLLSHSVDLAHFLVGDITEVVGVGATFITERPLPAPGGTHYDRGAAGGPSGAVTNEDYAAAIVRFAGGAIGTFESSRHDGRAGEPERLRRARHARLARRGTSSG